MNKNKLRLALFLALILAGNAGTGIYVRAEEPEEILETEEEEELLADAPEEEEEFSFEEVEVAPYDPLAYITLGNYTGLDVDVVKAEISDEDVDAEIESMLEENADIVDKEDGAEEGDSVSFSYTAEVEGEELESSDGENMELILGYADFGEEIDAALTGAKAGDTVQAEVLLDDLYGEEYSGKTAVYTLEVAQVFKYVQPELNDAFVQEYTSYDTVEAFRAGLKAELQAYAEQTGREEAGESALSQAVENAEMNGYPQDLYDYQYNSLLETYYMYFGDSYTDLVSEEDLADSVEYEVKAEMVLQALVQTEGLELTDEEFISYLENNLDFFGETFTSAEEVIDYYGEEELRSYVQRSNVCSWLLDHANIRELTQEEYDEIYGADDEYLDWEEDEEFDEDLGEEPLEDDDFEEDIFEEETEEAAAADSAEGGVAED